MISHVFRSAGSNRFYNSPNSQTKPPTGKRLGSGAPVRSIPSDRRAEERRTWIEHRSASRELRPGAPDQGFLDAPKRGDLGCPFTTPTVGPGINSNTMLIPILESSFCQRIQPIISGNINITQFAKWLLSSTSQWCSGFRVHVGLQDCVKSKIYIPRKVKL